MSPFEKMDLLTDEQKEEFGRLLEAALNLREENGEMIQNCSHSYVLVHSRRILDQLGLRSDTTEAILKYFESHGGYCDCEVMFNVICGED